MDASSIWLPGAGRVPLHMRAAAKAVRDYDADLLLGKDEATQEWVIFLERGPGSDGQPFPVFQLGRELPHPDAITKKLYMGDVRRRGRQILEAVNRRNADRARVLEQRAHEAAGEVAEVVEWASRKDGYRTNGRIFTGKGLS